MRNLQEAKKQLMDATSDDTYASEDTNASGSDDTADDCAPVRPSRLSSSGDSSISEDHDFLESLPEDLTCSICLSAFARPHLVSCCGHHFCEACIAQVKREGRACPMCRELGFVSMLNKAVQRRVNQLLVKCPHSSSGCSWTGKLSDKDMHVNAAKVEGDCLFVPVRCSNHGCPQLLQRSLLATHLKSECLRRPFSCQYCGQESTYALVVGRHWPVCSKYPVACPNEGCNEMVERQQLESHRDVCPQQIVECEMFQKFGCKATMPRCDLPQHMRCDVSSHLSCIASAFTEEQEKSQSLERQLTELEAKHKKVLSILKQVADRQNAHERWKMCEESAAKKAKRS